MAAGSDTRPVNLALQGGGAHGAFGWGVLDKLLEDGRFEPAAISATSAGAMNAVVVAYGMTRDGPEGGRAALHDFWHRVARASRAWSALFGGHGHRPFGVRLDHTPMYHFLRNVSNLWSPYQLNPFNLNPLKTVLEDVVDFPKLAKDPALIPLFISATNVRTGKIRIFENAELSAEVIMASACLPDIFQAVEIDGEHYWDGGFMGNPAIFPLIYCGRSKDVVIVHTNPLERNELPTTAAEIFDRVNEISFNSSLMREMRAIAFVTRLIDSGRLDPDEYARMLIHSIRADDAMGGFGVASKMNPSWDFLCRLRDLGRSTASDWLDAHADKIGQESSIDIAQVFL